MLHGKIEVNSVEIGFWSAVRAERVLMGTHWYDCEVACRNLEGYLKKAEFRLVHSEKDGALVLTSQVIFTGMRKLR